ncbi:hypothetical protein HUO13_17760 [Saccharopolyspora erythraea]|uniref:hypothetical protein n=1 Tax=Saccharopolyspora erythraea TaxID=1836 RepID=UPI001BA9A604|nr:hypothetical protein [Saccharopolyspora erythraea]QUH02401.1 hypothetical protein HUO13_17760 [Saccharopolyspora erythraea]
MSDRAGLKTAARSAGLVAAGAAMLVAVSAGTAHAATNWNAQNTPADIVGAHAWGTIDDAERFILRVNIKDTAGDSHGARVYVRVTYADGGTRSENLSASGKGVTNSTTWNFASSARKFEVQECLTEGGAKYECGGWHTIY